jgi:NitT/TauT family transport system substrate-binding protein
MNRTRSSSVTRRDFLAGASALGAASLIGIPRVASAESPPEVKKVRLTHTPAICLAPQFLAEEMLHLEGFSEVEYVKTAISEAASSVANGQADFAMWHLTGAIPAIDGGEPIVMLGAIHAGCSELIANEQIYSIRDLKGKRIGVHSLRGGDHIFIASMLAYIGVDPQKDVQWVVASNDSKPKDLFVEGKVDAFIGYAPEPQELRAKKIGRVIVDTAQDRPWSQYFCCAVFANKEFVAKYPVATKRTLRAFLKAADICAKEPERVARYLVDKGYEPRYEIGLEVLKSLPYTRWRDANPEDTLRFLSLRLKEFGMIKSTPQQIIEHGSNFSFLNELKGELKA